MNTEEYLTTLTQQIRCKAARDSVSEEIRQHIEDQIEAYLSCGTSPEEAEKLAIVDMGDPIETGAALDQIHRPKKAWPLLLGLVAFSLIGLLVQQYLSVRFPENFSPLIPSRIAGSLLFLLFAMGICFLDYTRIAARARFLYLGLCLILLLLPYTSLTLMVNGARTYLALGGFVMNLVLLAVLFAPLYGSIVYRYHNQSYQGILKCVLWMVPAVFVILRMPSSMYAFLFLCTCFATLIFAVMQNWFQVKKSRAFLLLGTLFSLLPLSVVFLYFTVFASYQKERLLFYLSPYPGNLFSYRLQMIHQLLSGKTSALTAAASGGEPALTFQSYHLTYLCASMGVFALILLICGLCCLILNCFRITLKQQNRLGQLVGFSSAFILALQILLYLAVNLGLGNVSLIFESIYCPFFSPGYSGALSSGILFGILLSICRFQNITREPHFNAS